MSARVHASLPTESATTTRKPRLSIFVATACGLGYLPKAPGTWGSLGGLVFTVLPFLFWANVAISMGSNRLVKIYIGNHSVDPYLLTQTVITVVLALIGVWTAGRAARFWREEDPQRVVIDEVSGQHLTLLLGCGLPVAARAAYAGWNSSPWAFLGHDRSLNWKYLLVGLILFRVFDVWKPFPARQAESLPGGWGIMADDWMAAVYAALILWIARALGL